MDIGWRYRERQGEQKLTVEEGVQRGIPTPPLERKECIVDEDEESRVEASWCLGKPSSYLRAFGMRLIVSGSSCVSYWGIGRGAMWRSQGAPDTLQQSGTQDDSRGLTVGDTRVIQYILYSRV